MTVSSEDKAEVFVSHFSRNYTLDSKGQQPPPIPDEVFTDRQQVCRT